MMIRATSLFLSLLAHGTVFLYFSGTTLSDVPSPAAGKALQVTVLRAGEGRRLPTTPQQPAAESASENRNRPVPSAVAQEPGGGDSTLPPPEAANLEADRLAPQRDRSRVLALREPAVPSVRHEAAKTSQVPQRPAPSRRPAPSDHPPPRPPTPLPDPRQMTEAGRVENVAVVPVVTAQSVTVSRPPSSETAPSLSAIEQRYTTALLAAIETHKHYPLRARRRGEQGEVRVHFTIQRDGTIAGVRVAVSSESRSLDRAASGAVSSLGRFDPIPSQLDRDHWEFQVPIRFGIR